jgi:hypothetical protein
MLMMLLHDADVSQDLHERAKEGARTIGYNFFGAVSPRTAISPRCLYEAVFDRPTYHPWLIPYEDFVSALKRSPNTFKFTLGPHEVVHVNLVFHPTCVVNLEHERQKPGGRYEECLARIEELVSEDLHSFLGTFKERFGFFPPRYPYHHRFSKDLGFSDDPVDSGFLPHPTPHPFCT